MTKSECRAIFKQAWYKAIRKDIYTDHVMGYVVARANFMSALSMLLFPENLVRRRYCQHFRMEARSLD